MIFPILLEYGDWGLLALRLVIAAIFLYHAMPKLKMPGMMATMMKMPAMMIFMMGVFETAGAIFVATGLFYQVGALILGTVMVGAIWFKITTWKTGFSSMQATGWEFDLVLLAASAAILLGGVGSIAL